MPNDVDEFLEHFGVKGMHWGVRRDRAGSDATARSNENLIKRVSSGATLAKYMADSSANRPLYKGGISEEEYARLSTKGEEFVKGTELKRITTNPEAVLRGQNFVSVLAEDQNFYRAAIPAVGPERGYHGGRKVYKTASYELTLQTTKALTGPSAKERVDTFTDILGAKAVKDPATGSTVTGRDYLESIGYSKQLSQLSDQEAGLSLYRKFQRDLGDRNSPINAAYYQSLSSKGYNFMLDDNDAGVFTKSPLILLDSEGAATVTGVHKLTADEINQAQRNLGKRKGKFE